MNEFIEQREFSIEQLEKRLELIESQISDTVAEKLNGKEVYLLYKDLYDSSYFLNTTVSDVLETTEGEFDVSWITDNVYEFDNVLLNRMRLPKKGEFQGEIRFTPKNTIVFEQLCIGKSDDGSDRTTVGLINKIPILQKERYIKDSCSETYVSNTKNKVNIDLERNAFAFLHFQKPFAKEQKSTAQVNGILGDISQSCHEMICSYYDIVNSWAVTYLYKNILFVIPVKQEFFKKLFKDRDKGENGRRNFVPTIVNGHKRKNGQSVNSHLRVGGTYLSIHGREFSYLIGAEDFGKIFPNTDYSIKKCLKTIEESTDEGKYMVINKKEKQF